MTASKVRESSDQFPQPTHNHWSDDPVVLNKKPSASYDAEGLIILIKLSGAAENRTLVQRNGRRTFYMLS